MIITSASRLLAVLAALGWVLSFLLSVAALVGLASPGWMMSVLFIAMFPIWLATLILLSWAMNGRMLTPARWWIAAIEQSPAWLRYLAFATIFCGFGLFVLQLFGFNLPGISVNLGLLGVFYAFALIVLSSTSRSVTCANGHRVGPFEQYCRECGVPVVAN